jgi:arylsulfatase A-like enzyme
MLLFEMKRHFLYAALLWCIGWLAIPLAAEPLPVKQHLPNILLIIADDLGLGDVRSFNATTMQQTPNIDALAARGMRFSRFYTDSTCSASRASLLTGQHPARLGFHPVARGVDPAITTMPEWFRSQGYSTHHIGKWHIGELNAEAKPAAQGFDTSFGFLNQWFLQGSDAHGEPVLRQPVYLDPWLENELGESRQYNGYLPDILTLRAAEKIEALAKTQQPWFLWYATPLPHAPLHAPPDANNVKIETDDKKYAAMVAHLDRNVGELLGALVNSGQRENTIVVFLSDNGAPEKRSGSNAGFSGGKAHYSEGAVRTPMIWVDPGFTMPESLDERTVTIADVFPTLAARVGKPLLFSVDGVDWNNLDNVRKISDRPLYWMSRGSSSVLSTDKLWRSIEEWVFREKKSFQLLRIGASTADDNSPWRFWYFRLVSSMQEGFRLWLEEVSRTAVKQDSPNRVSGNDFLRTPLREWDFYLAVSPDPSAHAVQVLAEQAGIWSMRYNADKKMLSVDMHGHQWEVPYSLPSGCTLIGLNADIYDRYTNLVNTVNPTELLLSVNGKEVARTGWQIDSLANVKISEPTWIGISASGSDAWQGKLSGPVFYHRANIVGEWPYLVNELAIQQELCRQL